MSPVNPLFVILLVSIAVATSAISLRFFPFKDSGDRFSTIDGLRGYLAFFVFLHHSSSWYFYLRSGHWAVPPSSLYTHLEQDSVALFFMVTGFLFFSKIIDGRLKKIDWMKLFVSRVFRLAPLYFVLMAILFIFVAIKSEGRLNEPIGVVILQATKWLFFTVPGRPGLNGVDDLTLTTIAGVVWSLPYEWYFYLSLPLLSFFVGVRPPVLYFLISFISTVMLYKWGLSKVYLFTFIGGVAASLLVRFDGFCTVARSSIGTFAILVSICAVPYLFSSAYGVMPTILLSIVFAGIAAGNGVFGILTARCSRSLGELAFSIYLLHSVVLYILFYVIIGFERAKNLSVLEHWIAVALTVPVLIVCCHFTFRYIEQRGIRLAPVFLAWYKK